jgi:putative MATE family efflux protein
MRTPAEVIPLASAYMRVLFVGLPAMFFYQFLMNILRSAGDAKTPFVFMLWSVGLDIVLNPLLIFGIGPIPKLGIAGSALATVLAQTAALTALLITVYRRKFFLCIHAHELNYLRMRKQVIKILVMRGIPMGLNMLVVSSSLLFTIALVNPYGANVVAALGAASQVWTYVQMPGYAVGASVSAMAAQNIGAARWERLPSIAAAGIRINLWLTGVPVLALYVFDRVVVSLFLPADSPAIAIAAHMNAIALWGFVAFALAFVYQAIPRASGAVLVPMLILMTSFWVLRLPFAMIASKYWGVDGVWWSSPFGNVANGVMAWFYYKYGNWRSIRLFDRGAATTAPIASTSEPS